MGTYRLSQDELESEAEYFLLGIEGEFNLTDLVKAIKKKYHELIKE